MARPVDLARRQTLLDAAVDYVMEHGLADLSWRPLAEATGVSTTTLVHHFGTKDELIQTIFGRVRERILEATVRTKEVDQDPTHAAHAIWRWSAAPERRAWFRLFFAIYGQALQDPARFDGFLDRVIADWMDTLQDTYPDSIVEKTLYIAAVRGLLLDLLTTGDDERVQQAFDVLMQRIIPPLADARSR